MTFFLQSVVAVFVVFALIIWTASAFIAWQPPKTNWYIWAWGSVAVAAAAQAALLMR